jgi:hypothetical protein
MATQGVVLHSGMRSGPAHRPSGRYLLRRRHYRTPAAVDLSSRPPSAPVCSPSLNAT